MREEIREANLPIKNKQVGFISLYFITIFGEQVSEYLEDHPS